jgi:hypothetical protein
MKAGELTSEHLGKDIVVTDESRSWTRIGRGMLAGVNHSADIISEKAFGDAESTYALGQRRVFIHFIEGSTMVVRSEAHVEIHD